jgi:hypothetical protein
MQYGRGGRHAHGAMGPDSPEGDLSEEQLNENLDDVPSAIANSEFIDDEMFTERMAGLMDYSKIKVPLLSAGNWVCSSFQLDYSEASEFD